ncbi:MAG: hypothetical protein NVSMB9_13980 [Isosphaeraceae bacterium]
MPVSRRFAIFLMFSLFGIAAGRPTAGKPPADVKRIVFLGDSITYSGQYVAYVEACLRLNDRDLDCEFLNLGLPSETLSGLTEPGHAEGKFPRPWLHERLDRVLENTRPDLVVACYGMNDGIYYPFSDERFHKYQAGIKRLREKVEAAGAKVLHLTPPVFDFVPIRDRTLPAGLAAYPLPYAGYDDVLERYSAWLLGQKEQGWDVVSVHAPLRKFLDTGRKRDPDFRLADDGVHLNAKGHWLIARQILAHWDCLTPAFSAARDGEEALSSASGPGVLRLIRQRQEMLRDSWLSTIGHARPGISPGLPREEAARKAVELDRQIRSLLRPAR